MGEKMTYFRTFFHRSTEQKTCFFLQRLPENIELFKNIFQVIFVPQNILPRNLTLFQKKKKKEIGKTF